MQSGAKTGDSADPSQTTEDPSFLSYTLSTASHLTNLAINGIYYGPVLAWEAVTGAAVWVISMCSMGISALWASVTSMATWLGSVAHAGLSLLLQTLYLILDLLQIAALAVASFFSSSFSYISGFILPVTQTKGTEGAEASQTYVEWMSQAYTSITEAAHKTQTWVWDSWLLLVVSVADALTAVFSSLLWLLGFLWSLVWYMISGLWTVLVYIVTGTVGLVSSACSTVASGAVAVTSTVASSAQLVSGVLKLCIKRVIRCFLTINTKSSSQVLQHITNRVSVLSICSISSKILLFPCILYFF